MSSKEEIEEALKWVKERIKYITQNCDLQDEDYKRTLYVLKNINICLQEVIKQNNEKYWEGYIQKQNEAVEICKKCKYRKKYIEESR